MNKNNTQERAWQCHLCIKDAITPSGAFIKWELYQLNQAEHCNIITLPCYVTQFNSTYGLINVLKWSFKKNIVFCSAPCCKPYSSAMPQPESVNFRAFSCNEFLIHKMADNT